MLSGIEIHEPCSHVTSTSTLVKEVDRPARGCEECLAIGSRWVHLRVCLTCGHVGCCDSSPNRHATAHHRSTKHPIITSGEANERWAYCYEDDAIL